MENNNLKQKKTKESEYKLEGYKPGATQAQVFKALKKVAKNPKPSKKHAQ